jgi:hypothetical protein
MARQPQSRSDRVSLYEKPGPNPAAIFIAAQKAARGMGQVFSFFQFHFSLSEAPYRRG